MTAAQRITERSFCLGRLEVLPDLSGALWLPVERMLVVADLHLEKGSAFAARGRMLPPYDTQATLARLALAIARFDPRVVVALGDSFHDRGACNRMRADDRAVLSQLQVGRDWLWITGNHDPEIPDDIGGDVANRIEVAGVVLRHEPTGGSGTFEIAGHLHPAAKVRMSGRAIRRRCFAMGRNRCVMPAMGAYAGGLNVRDAAFAPLFQGGLMAHMLGDSRLYVIDGAILLPD
jgi:hypothetical protein